MGMSPGVQSFADSAPFASARLIPFLASFPAIPSGTALDNLESMPPVLFQRCLPENPTDGSEPLVVPYWAMDINDVVQFVMGKVEEKSLTILTRPRSNSC